MNPDKPISTSRPAQRDDLMALIVARLESCKGDLWRAFEQLKAEVGVRYCCIDELLPEELARRIHERFPMPESMRLMDSFRAKKYTSKSFDKFDPLLADITFAVQDPRAVELVELITGIEGQIPGAKLHAEGLHAMTQGHFMGPQIDNSHGSAHPNYRTLNRPTSWHSVSPVKADRVRGCVSNDCFAPLSPTGRDYFNITAFSARPKQKLLRAAAWVDGRLRSAVRRLVPRGLGRKDVYEVPPR